jgi:GNAT superfamily N-acetyltransferase
LTGDDRHHIEAVFDGLSDQDRYYRFFRPMPTYPTSVLQLLTSMDGVGHVAVGAFDGDTCVGVARFIRSTRRPESAEVAVTVAGTHRGCGLARRMVESLDRLAADRGIDEFEVVVHPSNRAAASLFRSMGFTTALEDGSVIGHRRVGIDQHPPNRRATEELVLAA